MTHVPPLARSASKGWTASVAWLLAAFTLLGCSDKSSGPITGSNSNWLVACERDDDCGGATNACVCGACTRACADEGACSALPGARCAGVEHPGAWSQCESREAAVALCLPACTPGSCAAGQACVEGACVFSAFPDTELCAGIGAADPATLVGEEELLAALQARRVAGGTACGAEAELGAVAAVRLDPRLRCVARFLSLDVEETRSQSLVDSLGRSTPERLALAGYAQRVWFEAFELDVLDAEDALSGMLAQTDVCTELLADNYTDVGVGRAGDVAVITVAAE